MHRSQQDHRECVWKPGSGTSGYSRKAATSALTGDGLLMESSPRTVDVALGNLTAAHDGGGRGGLTLLEVEGEGGDELVEGRSGGIDAHVVAGDGLLALSLLEVHVAR